MTLQRRGSAEVERPAFSRTGSPAAPLRWKCGGFVTRWIGGVQRVRDTVGGVRVAGPRAHAMASSSAWVPRWGQGEKRCCEKSSLGPGGARDRLWVRRSLGERLRMASASPAVPSSRLAEMGHSGYGSSRSRSHATAQISARRRRVFQGRMRLSSCGALRRGSLLHRARRSVRHVCCIVGDRVGWRSPHQARQGFVTVDPHGWQNRMPLYPPWFCSPCLVRSDVCGLSPSRYCSCSFCKNKFFQHVLRSGHGARRLHGARFCSHRSLALCSLGESGGARRSAGS